MTNLPVLLFIVALACIATAANAGVDVCCDKEGSKAAGKSMPDGCVPCPNAKPGTDKMTRRKTYYGEQAAVSALNAATKKGKQEHDTPALRGAQTPDDDQAHGPKDPRSPLSSPVSKKVGASVIHPNPKKPASASTPATLPRDPIPSASSHAEDPRSPLSSLVSKAAVVAPAKARTVARDPIPSGASAETTTAKITAVPKPPQQLPTLINSPPKQPVVQQTPPTATELNHHGVWRAADHVELQEELPTARCKTPSCGSGIKQLWKNFIGMFARTGHGAPGMYRGVNLRPPAAPKKGDHEATLGIKTDEEGEFIPLMHLDGYEEALESAYKNDEGTHDKLTDLDEVYHELPLSPPAAASAKHSSAKGGHGHTRK